MEGAAIEAGDHRPVDVARAPAAALGEQDDRQPAALGDLEEAVLLEVAAHALGAGQDGVVVGHHDGWLTVDVADARDQAVGGGAGDELVLGPAALLGGVDQRPVLDERAGVDEVSEVLARRALPALVAPGDRVGPRAVEPDGVALADRGEIVADRVEVDGLGALLGGRGRLAGGQHGEELALVDRVAHGDLDAPHDAVGLGDDLVLHLHRLEHDDRRAGADRLGRLVGDRDHGAGEGGRDGDLGRGRHRGIIAHASSPECIRERATA